MIRNPDFDGTATDERVLIADRRRLCTTVVLRTDTAEARQRRRDNLIAWAYLAGACASFMTLGWIVGRYL